jgi:hypothetical protein
LPECWTSADRVTASFAGRYETRLFEKYFDEYAASV